MKTFNCSLVVFFLVFFTLSTSAQTKFAEDSKNRTNALLMQAYTSYNKALFLEARSIFADSYSKDKTNMLLLYYITLIDYKLLEVSLSPGNDSLFDKYYEGSINNAEKLIGSKDFEADGKILLAGIYMMKIATSNLSAVTLTPKIHSLLDDAQKIAPGKPYSYIIRGEMKYNTPGIFGGSFEDASKNFSQAIKLYEKDENENTLNPVWGYIEALAWAGRTQEKLENYEAAEFNYKKALNKQPEFSWVKYSLLPAVEKKLAEK